MRDERIRRIVVWVAIVVSACCANFWAFWGINENFHEGWYSVNFLDNLLMMFGQYLSMPIAFMLLSFISIRWNRIGSVLFLLLSVGSYLLFGKTNAGFILVAVPLAALGVLYWFGRLERRRLAYFLVIGLPLVQIIGIGTYHTIRVAGRYDDGQFGTRVIEGNGIKLTWAPQGPGWPDDGTSWLEAKWICAHLNRDGTALEDTAVNLWRLPTVEESVRSMVHNGTNAGGEWNAGDGKATYRSRPDKESPLWNSHVKTIYWWTSTEVDSANAYIVVYDGGVWRRRKTLRADYLNFRAVKDPQ